MDGESLLLDWRAQICLKCMFLPTDMSFPLQLLWIWLHKRKEVRDVEHDLSVLVNMVNWLLSRLTVQGVQSSTVSTHEMGREIHVQSVTQVKVTS